MHRIAVYLCTDQRYLPYTLFLAGQIAAAHPNRDFDICIVSTDKFAPHPLFKSLGLRILQIDTGTWQQCVLIKDRIGFATYLRAFMPRLWHGEYDRLLYLDGDVFYQRGDISALLRAPMPGCALAAAADKYYWGRSENTPKMSMFWARQMRPISMQVCC
jgi:lipopolysaccharide biosynthesis glycosyltransferase